MGEGIGWQEIAAGLVVLAAVAYLVWKLGVAPRLASKGKRGGPDVPVGRLTRKKPKKSGDSR